MLAARTRLHRFVLDQLNAQEVHDGLLLAAAALVVLPLLPDRAVDPLGAFNPRVIWLLAILVMTINAAGYVALRAFGAAVGLPLSGLAGGFVSSTATHGAMGSRALAEPGLLRPAIAGAALSSLATPIFMMIVLAVAGLPMGLILLQPDLGTMLVFAVITFTMLAVAGLPLRYLAGLVVAAIIGTSVVLGSGVLAEYQRDRLLVFIESSADMSLDESYNVEQSQTAISLGGLTGWGWGEGPQTQDGFVPEQETDFIFTAVGEELGFVGAAALLALFLALCLRIARAAQLARDDFGTLLCSGVLAMFAFQIFENVGMTMRIMPVTGIPLPFVSYGGSSLLTTLASVGVVLSVHMHRFR